MSLLSEPGSARQEAEKLVATVLAAATVAANAHPQLSTGSAECCVCPLCKVIAAVRDPDPEMVERVATGAGDLAAGIASFLRTLSAVTPTSPPTGDAAWKEATRAQPEEQATARPPKKVVKKTVKKAVKKAPPRNAHEAKEG